MLTQAGDVRLHIVGRADGSVPERYELIPADELSDDKDFKMAKQDEFIQELDVLDEEVDRINIRLAEITARRGAIGRALRKANERLMTEGPSERKRHA